MSNNQPLHPTTEIMTSFLSAECESNDSLKTDVKKDAVAALYAQTNIDFKGLNISVVENSNKEVSLVLPYYEKIEELRADMLSDSQMGEVAGGEIFASLAIFFGTIGTAIGVGATVITATSIGFTGAAIAAGVGVTAAVAGTVVAATAAVGAGVAVGGVEAAKAAKNK